MFGLTLRQQKVLVLHIHEGRTLEEVGLRLGIKKQTVAEHMQLINRKLKKHGIPQIQNPLKGSRKEFRKIMPSAW